MTGSGESHVSDRRAPHRNVPTPKLCFALFGGPLAWFLQLNAGYAMATQPCFVERQRVFTPHLAHDWTGPALAIVAAALVIALLSTLTAWHIYRRACSQGAGNHRTLMEVGAGRTGFLALWGICLGSGSALAITTSFVFFVLPRCAG